MENNQSQLLVVNIAEMLDIAEKVSGRKVVDSSFENDTLTVFLEGRVVVTDIVATISIGDRKYGK